MRSYSIQVTPQETSELWPTMWVESSRWVWKVTADDGPRLMGASGPAWTKFIGVVKARWCRMSLMAQDRRVDRSKKRVAKFATRLAEIPGGTG